MSESVFQLVLERDELNSANNPELQTNNKKQVHKTHSNQVYSKFEEVGYGTLYYNLTLIVRPVRPDHQQLTVAIGVTRVVP